MTMYLPWRWMPVIVEPRNRRAAFVGIANHELREAKLGAGDSAVENAAG